MRKRRAVVIDDERIIVDLLAEFFSTRGYEVLSYTAPVVCPLREAEGKPCDSEYPCADVIITDFKMPGMNGLDLLEEQFMQGCKVRGENKALTSGYLDGESHSGMKQRGYAFFQKPIDFSKLSAWLDECETRMDLSRPLGSRRKETRHATHYEVRCLVDRTEEIVNGITVDISTSGLRLKLATPVTTGQILHIGTEHVLDAFPAASVRWVRRNSDGFYQAGLSYH